MTRLGPVAVSAVVFLAGCAGLPARDEIAAMPGPHAVASFPLGDGRARFRQVFCGVLAREGAGEEQRPDCSEWLWQLPDEQLAPARDLPAADLSPRVYLVTGAFSECLGEAAQPFRDASGILNESGHQVETIVVSGRSGSDHNARQIAERLEAAPSTDDSPVVLIGYSKGVNDVLQFLVSYPRLAATIDSVVGVAGAVGGSPLASNAAGAYDLFLAWVPSTRCRPGDGQVIDSLRSDTRSDWLAANPLPDHVRYFSVAAFTTRERVASALVPSWELLLHHDLRNDGQVLARDALIPGSTLLGYLDADHWSVAIDVEKVHPVLGSRRDDRPFPRGVLLEAILLQLAEIRRQAPAVPTPSDPETVSPRPSP